MRVPWKLAAAGALALLLVAGCEEPMSSGYQPPEPSKADGQPDLRVLQPSVSDGTPVAGETFTLSATVRNDGAGLSARTTLRYYRSSNTVIVAGSDTLVGTDDVPALAASGGWTLSLRLTAPEKPDTYYYGACVDVLPSESVLTNNCSAAVSVTVEAAPEPEPEPEPDDERPAPVDHPGQPLVQPVLQVEKWGPVAEPVIDWDRFREPEPAPDLIALIDGTSRLGPKGYVLISPYVKNIGHSTSSATTVRLYQSHRSVDDGSPAASDEELWQAAVPSLRVREYWEHVWAVIAPSYPGIVFYWLCVDPVPGEVDQIRRVSWRLPAAAPNCDVLEVTVDANAPSYWPRRRWPLIADSDPSSYTNLAWVGENRIRVWHSAQSSRSVYQYEARYADQQMISVMVDQGFSRSRADELATFYARRIGQLPALSALAEFAVLVCCSDEALGYADTGNNRIAIFHRDSDSDSATFGAIILHEYAHVAYDAAAYADARWRAAVAADGRFITEYAADFPYREDVADSYVAWFAVRCRSARLWPADVTFIESAIPARLAYFDALLGGRAGCRLP